MSTTTTTNKAVICVRVPSKLDASVRAIAKAEGEVSATIWRRIMRLGVAAEEQRRERESNEAS